MMQRPRAAQACTHCRARKVRCDATRTGIPCSNCVFDSKNCYVIRRKHRGERYQQTEKQRIDQSSSIHPQIIQSIEDDHELPKHRMETSMRSFLPTKDRDFNAGATSTLGAFIPWSQYEFLSLATCSRLPQYDMESWNRENCLLIPRRPLLDYLIQEYFLHVHPNLPVMDESEFWDIYHGKSTKPISLICLQAMMFAGSSVCLTKITQ
ncbi:hypothetical protein VI817_010416 [Penicillium citrinum]|nr:hypothetical protein VI817_010416 [Penicillium citrinum]